MPKGFASLSPERLKEIASLGGKAVQAKGLANRFTSEQARAAQAKRFNSEEVKTKHMQLLRNFKQIKQEKEKSEKEAVKLLSNIWK